MAELCALGFRRFAFLLGHRHEAIERHLDEVVAPAFPDIEVELSVEPAPLGTAGALAHAARLCEPTFFLFNADSYFELDPGALLAAHRAAGAIATIAACPIDDASRYGALAVSERGLVERFVEKGAGAGPSLINAGAYVLSDRILDYIPADEKVSLEHETFPALLRAGEPIAAVTQPGTFFDIGTPASYRAFARFVRDRPTARRGSS